MKDLVIPAKSIRRELLMLALSVLLAWVVNAGAIMAYKTQWIELLTTWRITLVLALVLYVVMMVPRVCWAVFRRWLRPKRPLARESKGSLLRADQG
jgi:hypothetical protein